MLGPLRLLLSAGFCGYLAQMTFAYDLSRNDNLAVYWGQDSAGNQQPLRDYCEDDTIDIIPLAFLYTFFGEGGLPVVSFGNTCDPGGQGAFKGTDLAECQSSMASDISFCQSQGKAVILSLGGADSSVGLSSSSQATEFAKTIWDLFLGGSSSTRPFGNVELDGVDLDIEHGSPNNYGTFVNELKILGKAAKKTVLVTAAPQCPYPDANIGPALNEAPFDAVFVQFYNNYCELSAPSEYNVDTWIDWAKNTSPNPDVKVFIGAAASKNAAGQGYVGPDTLAGFVKDAQKESPSFGGVMLWDASEAKTNDNYDRAAKSALIANGGKTSIPGPSSSGSKSSSAASSSSSSKKPTTTSTSKPAPTESVACSPNHHIPIPNVTSNTTVAEIQKALAQMQKGGKMAGLMGIIINDGTAEGLQCN